MQFAPESMGAWVLRSLGLAEEGTTGVNIVSVPVDVVAAMRRTSALPLGQ